MKKLLLAASAATVLIASTASAAVNDNAFTGFKFGVQGGYSHNKVEFKNKTTNQKEKFDPASLTLGLFTEYGVQFDNNVYLGGELEGNIFGGSEKKTTSRGATKLYSSKVEMRHDLGANLKTGYVFNEDMLAYVLAGINTTSVKFKHRNFSTPANNFTKSKNFMGYKVGAGVEKKFKEKYVARAQYDYKFTKKENFNNFKTDLDQHNFRVGFGMII